MSYTFEDHTSEVRLHIEASTLEELFEEAARALFELQSEAKTPVLLTSEVISVAGRDDAALLVAWLNELIFLSETKKRLYPKTVVESANGRVIATVHGAEPGTIRTAVKAATMHRASVNRMGAHWEGNVILDV
jgi:SHS2 domain-containing protein